MFNETNPSLMEKLKLITMNQRNKIEFQGAVYKVKDLECKSIYLRESRRS